MDFLRSLLMRIGIVDDQAEDRRLLRTEMSRCLENNGMEPAEYYNYSSGDALIAEYQEGLFDLLFLDICMDGSSGIETALTIRKVDVRVRIIFVTASNDYAAESYQVKASYYLLKPHTFVQFHDMFMNLVRSVEDPVPENSLLLPDGSRIAYQNIIFTEYHNHYVYFHLRSTQDTHRTYMSQGEIEDLLCSRPEFASCSRGIIVNFDRIIRFSDTILYLQDGSSVPVSRRRLHSVKDAYAQYMYLS